MSSLFDPKHLDTDNQCGYFLLLHIITAKSISLRLFDIADDLWGDNYTLRHLKDRINIYNEEQFPYNIKQFKL